MVGHGVPRGATQQLMASDMLAGINSFVEPSYLVYEIDSPGLDKAIADFKAFLSFGKEDQALIARCMEQRVLRNKLQSDGADATVRARFLK